MLTIRKEQYEVFREKASREFTGLMTVHLREAFPEQTAAISDTDLSGFVARGGMRAESYGITIEDDVQYFLDCMMKYGEKFDTAQETNWAGQILRTPCLKGSEKVTTLRKFAAKRRDTNGANCR